MTSSFRTRSAALVASLVVPAIAAAQQPHITNGTVTSQPAAAPFVRSFQAIAGAQPDVAWVGYSVPTLEGHFSCCSGSGDCRLEPSSSDRKSVTVGAAGGVVPPVKLEGATHMLVLFRVADRQVERIRVFSEDCVLDAGGRPVQWIDKVDPVDSIALLETFATRQADSASRDRVAGGAIMAIALHGGGGRERGFDTLARLSRTAASTRTRGDALFWLAQQSDRRAPATILDALQKDSSSEVRKKAVFALSQVKDDGGVPPLIEIARTHTDTAVRGEAIFWLGQKAGSKAAAAITERIDQDPDTEVKKKAVFALSQLPRDEGVPLLIKVARTNGNPAVRKQAMFWLGQSKDPRAIDFFAEILK